MKKLLCAALILAVSSVTVQAKQLTKEQLPAKVIAHFNKKHPKTSNLVITEQKHFGQTLYELNFTEELTIRVPDEKDVKGEKLKDQVTKEEAAVFYRTNGHFFVNSEKIYAFNIIPGVVINGLKAAFPDYKITAAQLVINPNGPGEEYEITITSAGQSWNVGLNSKGMIITKDNLTAPAPAAPTEKEKPAAKEVAAPKK
jgi:hypothetical protein